MDYFKDSRVVAAEARHSRRRRRAGAVYGILDRIFFVALLALALLVIVKFAGMALPHIFGPTPAHGQALGESPAGGAEGSQTAAPVSASGRVLGDLPPAGEGLPVFRNPGSVAVMAKATARWAWVHTDVHDLLGDYRFLPPYATENTRGQVFELLEAETGWTPADAQGQFVVVPWTMGCGCADEGWGQPGWVTPGDTVAFILSRTRSRLPSAWTGPPVYDVLGWHQPYPAGDFIAYWRTTLRQNSDWLTTREFFELLQVLPSEYAFRLDPSASFQSVLAWLNERPDRRGAFPVPTILSEWEKRVGP
jgi:hypothetical protein